DAEGAPVHRGKDRLVHRAAVHHHFHLVGEFAADAVVADAVAIVADVVGLKARHQAEDVDEVLGAGQFDQRAVDDGDTGGGLFGALGEAGDGVHQGDVGQQVALGGDLGGKGRARRCRQQDTGGQVGS